MNNTSWWWFEDNFLPPQMKNVYPRVNPIDYKVNSYGYRCPEFDKLRKYHETFNNIFNSVIVV
jgi:hypothetical protein